MACFSPTTEIFNDCLKPKWRIVFVKHLNYMFRYEVNEEALVVSNRQISFNVNQICPSEQRCLDGHCSEVLCQIPADEFTTCCFEWSEHYEDPEPAVKRGKKLEVSADGTIDFVDVVVLEPVMDLNWRRLRNMARPIVDEAIGKLAMSGLWEKNPMRLHLGSLLVDNKRVCIDEQSYFEMPKDDDTADLERCSKKWKEGGEPRFQKKNSDENTAPVPKNIQVTYRRDEKEKQGKVKKEDTKGTMLCELCLDDPCVWIAKKEEMLDYDDNEHEHLPVDDYPPHNVRRKKIYRQMALYINSGPSGKGVRIELPKCVVDGCRECFPSPTFMGFKEKN
jgi:hypothetical protein